MSCRPPSHTRRRTPSDFRSLRRSLPRLLVATGLGLLATAAGAQTIDWTARKNGGMVDAWASPHAAVVGPNGVVYVTGASSTGSRADFLTVAYDAVGNLLWARTKDGSNDSTDEPAAIALSADGHVVVTGWGGTSYTDFLTVAYDSAGNELWTRVKSSVAIYGHDRARDLAIDAAGNIYVTGETGALHSQGDFMTVAYDAAGNELWTRVRSQGGTDRAWQVAVGGGNQVYVAGETDGSSSTDLLTIAYDSSGTELWARVKDGPGGGEDTVRDLVTSVSGSVFLAGKCGPAADGDFLTLGYDSSGGELWTRVKDGAAGEADGASGIAVDASGNVYVTGSSNNVTHEDVMTVSYDGSGSERWTSIWSGPGDSWDVAYSVAVSASQEVFVTGRTSHPSSGSAALTVGYAGASGAELWARVMTVDAGGGAAGHLVATLDPAQQVYVVGVSWSADTDSDFLVLSYDGAGNQLWARQEPPLPTRDRPGGVAGWQGRRALAVASDGRSFVTGRTDDGWAQDFLTVAFDSEGNELWSASKDGPVDYLTVAYAVAFDDVRERVYVTGRSHNGGDYDYLTVAYDSAGNELWSRVASTGWEESPCCIAVAPNGNVVVAGYANLGANGGPADFLTLAYDGAGTELWRREDGAASGSFDQATALAVGVSGNVYVGGFTVPNTDFGDFLILAYDAAGEPLWSAVKPGAAGGPDSLRELALGPGEVVLATGDSDNGTNDDFLTVAFDIAGNELWSSSTGGAAGGDDAPLDIEADPAGRVYVTGWSSIGGNRDFLTVAYDSTGHELWARERDGPAGGADGANALAIGADGTVYVTGESDNGTSKDFLTVAYTTAGNELFGFTYDGGGADVSYLAAAPASGGVLVGGYSQELNDDYFLVRLVGAAALFADGFESGDTSAWSATTP